LTDFAFVGGDEEEKQSQAVVLDGQIECRQDVLGNRKQSVALFEQNVAVVFLILVGLLVLLNKIEQIVNCGLHGDFLESDFDLPLDLLLQFPHQPLEIIVGFFEANDCHTAFEEYLSEIAVEDFHVVGSYLLGSYLRFG
jgi:hypothetical protein